MQLKDYQKSCLDKVQLYLEKLSVEKAGYDKAKEVYPALNADFTEKPWLEVTERWNYAPKKDGLGNPLPNFCMKVPTGGGKTLLAAHAIDLINKHYLKTRTGFVLWIVPTNQIYRQTLETLKDRTHPYRQVLDLSSGGRTQILEKGDRFVPDDVREKLVVMLLMLPSANRQNKETLKIFQDAGGFESFFPYEDHLKEHEELLKRFPNLDSFGRKDGIWGKQVKTSLGNTLRVLRPIIIIDEGQKAYSQGAQDTIRNFNPRIVVELSATPPPTANKLVEITGMQLHREEMIKLDINVINKTSTNWKDALLSSVERRNYLEEQAREHRANTGAYIRPICLVQVERTGKEQRGMGYIHAEDVRQYLIQDCLIPAEHIAIKSSERDDIEGIDLMSKEAEIRYIITKQALQEGWDCSFAYVLTILTNPKSKNALTQLVGRILRQPFARKTKVKALDECYVFCYQQSAGDLMRAIRAGLNGEGLGDLMGRIAAHSDDEGQGAQDEVGYRSQFKKFEGKIYLPHFAIQDEEGWREMRYEMDLASRIDWSSMDVSEMRDLPLNALEVKDELTSYGLSADYGTLIEKHEQDRLKNGGLKVDKVFMTRHIMEVVPNPWVAFRIAEDALRELAVNNSEEMIAANLVYVVEELVKLLKKQKDDKAEVVFYKLIEDKKVCFFLQKDTGYRLPNNIKVTRSNTLFNTNTGEPIQKSLFDKVDKDGLNGLEEAVALCLDEQDKLLWWYRNYARVDYHIQGHRREKIYPDFIAAKKDEGDGTDYSKVFVLETKGLHLKNEDTAYKKNIFDLCNRLAQQTDWKEIESEFSQKQVEFQVVFEDEWKKKVMEDFM